MTRKPLMILLGVVLAVMVALAATNPSKREYRMFLQSLLAQALQHMDSQAEAREQGFIRELLRLRGQQVIDFLVSSKTSRRNFGLFSMFETTALDVQLVVVGVGPWFYPISGDQEIMRKVGQLAF